MTFKPCTTLSRSLQLLEFKSQVWHIFQRRTFGCHKAGKQYSIQLFCQDLELIGRNKEENTKSVVDNKTSYQILLCSKTVISTPSIFLLGRNIMCFFFLSFWERNRQHVTHNKVKQIMLWRRFVVPHILCEDHDAFNINK